MSASGSTPGRLGLGRLGPTDLLAAAGDEGVERHVLRLEGRDRDALAARTTGTARSRACSCRRPKTSRRRGSVPFNAVASALSLTPAESKVAISRRILAAACTVGTANDRAGALAQPHVEVEDGRQAELLEDDRRSRLARTVPDDEVPDDLGGRTPRATSAAAAAMTPSTITGTRRDAAPDDESAQGGDLEAPELGQHDERARHPTARRARARSMTALLRASVASSIPVPRPVTSVGGATRCTPRSGRRPAWCCRSPCRRSTSRRAPPGDRPCGATSTPTSRAAPASARRHRRLDGQVAGARARRCGAPGHPSRWGWAWPRRRRRRRPRAPTWRARTLMAAPPAQKLATICAVTSWGHGVTPSATTPWSPANTATVTGSGTGGGHAPAMAHSWTPMSSRRPSDRGAWSGGRGTARRAPHRRPPVSTGVDTSRQAFEKSMSRSWRAFLVCAQPSVRSTVAARICRSHRVGRPVPSDDQRASSSRSSPRGVGTAMRTSPGSPKLVQSRTTMPRRGQAGPQSPVPRRAPSWRRTGRASSPWPRSTATSSSSQRPRPRPTTPRRSTGARRSGRADGRQPVDRPQRAGGAGNGRSSVGVTGAGRGRSRCAAPDSRGAW